MSVGETFTKEAGDNMTLPCAVAGKDYDPMSYPITWYKIEDEKEYQINTNIVVNRPFQDTGRYIIEYNKVLDDEPQIFLPLLVDGKSLMNPIYSSLFLWMVSH